MNLAGTFSLARSRPSSLVLVLLATPFGAALTLTDSTSNPLVALLKESTTTESIPEAPTTDGTTSLKKASVHST